MTMDRIPALLEPIQNRLNAATPGPWEPRGLAYNTTVGKVGDYRNLARLGDPLNREAWKNAEFIAAARTDTARLLAAVQAVTAIHKPRRHDPVMDGVWHWHPDAGQYDLCAHDLQRFPCPTVRAVVAALGGEA